MEYILISALIPYLLVVTGTYKVLSVSKQEGIEDVEGYSKTVIFFTSVFSPVTLLIQCFVWVFMLAVMGLLGKNTVRRFVAKYKEGENK